jgi:hypothetical protein
MVWALATGRRGETERHGEVKVAQGMHLPVEPSVRIGAMPVGPANTRAQFGNAESFEQVDCLIESGIFKREPLTNAQAAVKGVKGGLHGAVCPDESLIEMAIV